MPAAKGVSYRARSGVSFWLQGVSPETRCLGLRLGPWPPGAGEPPICASTVGLRPSQYPLTHAPPISHTSVFTTDVGRSSHRFTPGRPAVPSPIGPLAAAPRGWGQERPRDAPPPTLPHRPQLPVPSSKRGRPAPSGGAPTQQRGVVRSPVYRDLRLGIGLFVFDPSSLPSPNLPNPGPPRKAPKWVCVALREGDCHPVDFNNFGQGLRGHPPRFPAFRRRPHAPGSPRYSSPSLVHPQVLQKRHTVAETTHHLPWRGPVDA